MKTSRLLAVAMLVIAMWHTHAYAATTSSAPQGINYQSVARNGAGQILANQAINLRISIRDSAAAGAIIYQEHHGVTTNAFGTFSVVIGGGDIILGDFSGINWGTADKYVQTDMDFTGTYVYQTMGISKLQSVAYALYAGTSTSDIKSVKYDTSGVATLQTAGATTSSTRPVWMSGGNSGLTTVTNWLGTIDSRDVIIKVEALRLYATRPGGAWLATGTSAGTTPASGPGKRMEWIPAKGAFRAGTVGAAQWDDAYIGSASIAMGTDALASGAGSTAIGSDVSALADGAIAMGNGVIAKGANTMVIGAYNDTTMLAADSTIASDVLFQVGSGSSAASRSNALTVEKDGGVVADQMQVSKSLTIMPGSTSILISSTVSSREYSYMKVGSLGLPLLNTVTLANGTHTGQMLVVEGQALLGGVTNAGVQILDNVGNAKLNGNMTLSGANKLTVIWDGQSWVELSRSIF